MALSEDVGRRIRAAASALVGYLLAAAAFTWPLPARLSSRVMGPLDSDLGVYIWNLWVFGREARAGHFPLFTSSVMSLDRPVDLSLHNYTLFADILALPMLPALGLVATYNLLCLANLVAGSLAMFVLVRHVTARPFIAWLAGLLFGFSPMIVARATIHASLAAAAPLPLFAYLLIRLDESRKSRHAIAAGGTLAWAALCDPYYAVYCVVLTAWYVGVKTIRVECHQWSWRSDTRGAQMADAAIVLLLSLVAVILVTGGVEFALGPVPVRLGTLYTPVLLLTVAVVVRLLIGFRARMWWRPAKEWTGPLRLATVAAFAGAVLLSPLLWTLSSRALDGRFVSAPVLWRSSMPGADLSTLIMPNPNNPWFSRLWGPWLAAQPGGYVENVTSVTFVALAVILAAVGLARFSVPASWGTLAAGAASLALGPFVQVAGASTTIPTPWALLRYVPPVSWARSPSRFAVLVILAVSVIFGLALKALVERFPARRRVILATAAAALTLELLPAPRPLYDARVPPVYDTIARDSRDVRVLELPYGLRDGLSSFGDFSPASLVYQTHHGKPLFGGYLSRVSGQRVELARRRPVLAALMALSERTTLSSEQAREALERGQEFVKKTRLGYVVIDLRRSTPALEAFAVRALDLERVAEEADRRLYRPRDRNLMAHSPTPRRLAAEQTAPVAAELRTPRPAFGR